MFDDNGYDNPQRSVHPSIQPADIRIQNYQVKGFGKKFQQAVAKVKADDARLMQQKKNDTAEKKGLLTANLGSIYDVPDRLLMDSKSELDTQAGSTVYTESNMKFQ